VQDSGFCSPDLPFSHALTSAALPGAIGALATRENTANPISSSQILMPSRCQIVRYDIPLAKARGQHSPVYRRLLAMGFVRLDLGTRNSNQASYPIPRNYLLRQLYLSKRASRHMLYQLPSQARPIRPPASSAATIDENPSPITAETTKRRTGIPRVSS
jgi:hypothetical protein